MKKFVLPIIVSAVLLSACATSTTDTDAQITQDWPVEKLYTEAHDELQKGNYTRAVKLYGLLKSRFPYGRFAQQAQMDSAYALYLDEEKEKSLAEIEQFQKEYPNHKDMDYILYLKGTVQFNEDRSFMNKLAAQDWSDRDPTANRQAYLTFAELVKRYPNSRYANDAKDRMTKIVHALGGHEMAVARYYMERGAYLAAANRAKNIVTGFQNTPFVEEALAMMMSAYEKMQQPTLATDARRVLENNFPQSQYLKTGWTNPKKGHWWSYSTKK
ncbi:MAG: outer membrane protein assembly factor BamD [Neisseriaceae bacterium]|nr:outer membrane protein assembly factor BamD [Neisseriaceae bacterium]MBR1819650.1 outer membrane protein assembly factor BamD [Neisseriaceae bacterium]